MVGPYPVGVGCRRCRAYVQQKVPEEWRERVIVSICNEKDEIRDCGSYIGIKLMSNTLIVWERVV